MRIVVAVKYVPVLRALRFDPVTRRLVREGVPGEPSAFDLRALEGALALRARHGGEVVALTMGPPAARAALIECLALGADRGVHLCDPALAGSDTLATARALAAALRAEAADVVLLGRASVDAETGQVGPEVAELLDLPQATAVTHLEIDPAARSFVAERETDDGAEPGLDPATVGTAGSPTWVAGLEPVEIRRRAEILAGELPAALARALGERLRALARWRPEPPPLVARGPGAGDPVWVVAEAGPRGWRPVTAELLAKADVLAAALRAPLEAVVIGATAAEAADLAHAGADRVLVADDPALVPYTTEAHAAVLAAAIRARRPRLVLLASTVRGRDLAPRVAARLGLGLTGDAIDLDVDAEGRIRQLKPAFGGTIVAPILSRTTPVMATVRPGVLPAARPDPARRAAVERLAAAVPPARVRVTATHPAPAGPE